jgi:serine/threonine-protein kinase
MQPPVINPYPQPGDVLDGKYRIERMLGEGGMGAVAKAMHLLRKAPVALKFISPVVIAFPGAVERFVNEGVAASQIESDHVVKVFDVGRLPNGAPFLVMEFLDGVDLGQLLAAEGARFATERAVHFSLQMLRALQTAHAAGIVHRDMKPSNCFVIEKDHEGDFVKLVDFGISKVRTAEDAAGNANLTRTNSALGTPLYMSPEQARSPRDVDHRSDLYSVGAILYEMLCGRTPYTAESGEYTEILYKIFTTEPEPLQALRPGLPHGLADVVHRALARDREARFATAAEMAEALAPFADARSTEILTRIRAVRGRSLLPASIRPVTAVTPPAPPLRSPGPPGGMEDPAAAHGYAAGAGSDALRAPRVPTDVGVTRESTTSPPPAGRGPLAAVLGAVAALAATGGAVFLLYGRDAGEGRLPPPHTSATSAPSAPETGATQWTGTSLAGASEDATPVVLAPAPSASSSAQPPVPAPSGSASSGATPAPRTPHPGDSASAAPASTLPKQLSDLKFH